MKRVLVILSLAFLANAGGTAYGYWGFCCGPSLSFGIGLGPFLSCSVGCGPGYGYGYPGYYGPGYYSYACARPSDAYFQPVPPVADPAPVMTAPPSYYQPTQAPTPDSSYWVPSTPGSGRWVPDPTPYSFTAQPTSQPAPQRGTSNAPIVSIIRSPEGIPVYFVSH